MAQESGPPQQQPPTSTEAPGPGRQSETRPPRPPNSRRFLRSEAGSRGDAPSPSTLRPPLHPDRTRQAIMSRPHDLWPSPSSSGSGPGLRSRPHARPAAVLRTPHSTATSPSPLGPSRLGSASPSETTTVYRPPPLRRSRPPPGPSRPMMARSNVEQGLRVRAPTQLQMALARNAYLFNKAAYESFKSKEQRQRQVLQRPIQQRGGLAQLSEQGESSGSQIRQRGGQLHEGAPSSRSLNRKLQLTDRDPIRYAKVKIRRLMVASADRAIMDSTTLLKFKRSFPESTTAWLSGDWLYTLSPVEPPKGGGKDRDPSSRSTSEKKTEAEAAADSTPFRLLSVPEVVDSVVDNLYADLSTSLGNVKRYLKTCSGDAEHPKMKMRFGKILFIGPQRRSDLESLGPFQANSLESQLSDDGDNGLRRKSVLKTFDSGVTLELLRKVRSLVFGNVNEFPSNREKFVIEIVDSKNPEVTLLCTCRRGLQGDMKRLTLLKVRLHHVRYMVVDVACVEKASDLRLILTTQRSYNGDWEPMRKIVEKAVYDVKACGEGGVFWPLGCSSSGSYSVTALNFISQASISCNGRKWTLRQANRKSNDSSKGKFSYEIDVAAQEWTDNLKMWKDSYAHPEDLEFEEPPPLISPWSDINPVTESVSTLLKWVWENCL